MLGPSHRGGAFVAVICLVTAGCGGPARPGATTPHHQARGPLDLTKAALPYKILAAHGGKEIPVEEFYAALRAAQAVCVGEAHTNPHHHWAQLEILDVLTNHGELGGLPAAALGMEMFQRPFQGVLDDFARGAIDEGAMLSRTGWEARWGYDWAMYQPIVRMAVARGLPLLALNAPEELAHKIARQGVAGLSATERQALPELVLDDPAHRAFFEEAIGGAHAEMPAEMTFDNMYAAQVMWDETMADTAARWVLGGDGRRIVILAGEGHCIDPAIPGRVRRRGVSAVVSVQPVLDDGSSNVADALATPYVDYLLVLDATP